MYQKYLPTSTDSKEDRLKKSIDYALWKYEYLENVAFETTKEVTNQMRMNHLQAQMDALNSEMQSKSELARLDSAMEESMKLAKMNYNPITKESEFILQLKKMVDSGVPL